MIASFVHACYPALIALYIASALVALLGARGGASRLLTRAALAMSCASAAATLAVWIARWVEVEHFPLFGTYENALSTALIVTIVAALIDVRKRLVVVSPAMLLVAALLLAQGVQYDAMPYGLTISERSLVVDLHAVLAWLAFAVLAAAFAIAVRVAFSREATSLDAQMERLLTIGFVLHTAMLISGSFYKFLLFGKVWSWDPIETMALIAWLAYGTLLHMSLLAGWSGRRFARWTIGTFAILLISYRAIIYFPSFATYHVFDIGLKLHR